MGENETDPSPAPYRSSSEPAPTQPQPTLVPQLVSAPVRHGIAPFWFVIALLLMILGFAFFLVRPDLPAQQPKSLGTSVQSATQHASDKFQ